MSESIRTSLGCALLLALGCGGTSELADAGPGTDDAGPSADAGPDAALDRLDLVPLLTESRSIGGCEIWPGMPPEGSAMYRVNGVLIFFAGDDAFEYEAGAWTAVSIAGLGSVVGAFAVGSELLVFAPTGTWVRHADGSYEPLSSAPLPPRPTLFRGSDGEVYLWARFPTKSRLYRWGATNSWEYIFATQYGVADMAVTTSEILVLASYAAARLQRYQAGQGLVAVPLPEHDPPVWPVTLWETDEDRVYLLTSDGGAVWLFERVGASWVEIATPPCGLIGAPRGVLMTRCQRLQDGEWVPYAGLSGGDVLAFPDGELAATRGQEIWRLSDGQWEQILHPLAVEGTLTATDVGHADAVDDDGVVQFDESGWSRVIVPFDMVPTAVIRHGGHLLVGGREFSPGPRTVLARWDGTLWTRTVVTATASGVFLLAVRDDGDVFAAADCSLFHWNGASWTRIRGEPCQTGSKVKPVGIDLAGDQVVYDRIEGLGPSATHRVETWAGAEWTPVVLAPEVLTGQLLAGDGTLTVAMVVGAAAGELSVLDTSGWSAPVSVDGLWGTALSGTAADDVVAVDGDRFVRWNGSAVETLSAPVPLGTSLWSDGSSAWTAEPPMRCTLPP